MVPSLLCLAEEKLAETDVGVLGEEDEVAGLIDGDLEEKTLNGFGFGRSTTLPEKKMIIN